MVSLFPYALQLAILGWHFLNPGSVSWLERKFASDLGLYNVFRRVLRFPPQVLSGLSRISLNMAEKVMIIVIPNFNTLILLDSICTCDRMKTTFLGLTFLIRHCWSHSKVSPHTRSQVTRVFFQNLFSFLFWSPLTSIQLKVGHRYTTLLFIKARTYQHFFAGPFQVPRYTYC